MRIEAIRNDGPVGVGGWLGFRIVELLVITPIWAIIIYPSSHPLWQFVLVGLSALGMTSGLLLLLQTPIALRFVAVHLAACFVDVVWIIYYDLFVVKPAKHLGIALGITLFSLAMYSIWFLYFRKSVRVRNTFGRNL
jgi:hypothetical protein